MRRPCRYCRIPFEYDCTRKERYCSPQCRHADHGTVTDWALVEKSAAAPGWER
jgi:hypothetical protein